MIRFLKGSLVFQGAFLFLAFLALYLRGLSPSLAVEGDSGEFLTALRCAGVPHEPGYSFYMILILAASTIFPGSPEFGANFLSALCAALAAALTLPLGKKAAESAGFPEGQARAAGWASAMLMGTAGLLWEQALLAEAYSPAQALMSGLILLAALKQGSWGTWAAAGFLAGLGLGAHPFVPLAGLLALGFRAWVGGLSRFFREWKPMALVAGGLLGLSTTLYLPLRAHTNPALNFGNPADYRALSETLARASYGGGQPARSLERMGSQVMDTAGFLAGNWPGGILVWILAAAGLVRLVRGRPRLAWALASTLFLAGPALAWTLNFNHMDSSYYQSRVFFIPGTQLGALLAGLGLLTLFGKASGSRKEIPVLLGAAAFVLFAAVLGSPSRDRSRAVLSHDYGRHLLDALPPGAAIVTEGDNSLYPLFYFTLGRGERPDVAVLHRGALGAPWFRENLKSRHPDLILAPSMTSAQIVAANGAHRTIFFTEPREELPPGFSYWPEKGLYRAARMGEAVDLPAPPRRVLRGSPDARPWDWREQSILALQRLWYLRAAEVLARAGDVRGSGRMAVAGLWAIPPLHINYDRWVRQGLHKGLASVYASWGRETEALENQRMAAAIVLDPRGP